MTKIIGRRTSLGLGLESSRGTAVAPTYWIPVTDLGFDDKVEKAKNNAGLGIIDENNDEAITSQFSEGDYSGKLYDKSVGVEMTGLFGQGPTSVQRASSGVYDHTWSLAQNNVHKSLTVAVKEANRDARYALSMINSWALDLALDDFVKRTVNLTSKLSATATNTVAYVDENEFTGKDVTVELATTYAGLGSGSALKVKALSLEFAKNVEGLQNFGSLDYDDIVNKQFGISGNFEAFYDDLVARGYVFNNTKMAMRISIKNTSVLIGSTHNPELRFDFPIVMFDTYERSTDLDDIAGISVDFTCMYSIADSTSVLARLTNAYLGTNYS